MSKGRPMLTKVRDLIVPVFAIFGASNVFAAVPGVVQTTTGPIACLSPPCRSEPAHARLLMKDGIHEIDLDFGPAPYVENGTIIMVPGETLVFHFSGGTDDPGMPTFANQMAIPLPQNPQPSDSDFKNDTYTSVQRDPKTGENLYFLKTGSPFLEGGTAEEHLKGAAPNTMIVSYHQASGHPDMVLRIEHNFSRPVKYDAEIEPLLPNGLGKPEKTSTCPVMPVLSGNETWPYPLGAIRLENFRFVDTDKGFNCD